MLWNAKLREDAKVYVIIEGEELQEVSRFTRGINYTLQRHNKSMIDINIYSMFGTENFGKKLLDAKSFYLAIVVPRDKEAKRINFLGVTSTLLQSTINQEGIYAETLKGIADDIEYWHPVDNETFGGLKKPQ